MRYCRADAILLCFLLITHVLSAVVREQDVISSRIPSRSGLNQPTSSQTEFKPEERAVLTNLIQQAGEENLSSMMPIEIDFKKDEVDSFEFEEKSPDAANSETTSEKLKELEKESKLMEAESLNKPIEEDAKKILEDEDFIRQELQKSEAEKREQRMKIEKIKEARKQMKEPIETLNPREKLNEDRKERFFHQNSEDHAVKRTYSVVLTIIFVSIISVFTIMVIYARNFFQKFFDKYLLSSLKVIISDLIILICFVTFIELCYYHGILDKLTESIEIYGLCITFSVFAVFWLLIGLYYAAFFQFRINSWESHEIKWKDRHDMLRRYDILCADRANNRKLRLHFRDAMEYFTLKQDFIAPSYLPILGETFLRRDFNMAEYLGRSLAKVFSTVLSFSFTSVLLILVFVYIWTLICLVRPRTFQLVIFFIIPPILLVLLALVFFSLRKCKAKLTQSVKDSGKIFLNEFEIKRNPYINLNQIQPPKYLEHGLANQDSIRGRALSALRRFFEGIKTPNKQEALFFFSSPLLTLKFLNSFCIVKVIWVIFAFSLYLEDIKDSSAAICIFVLLFLSILFCFFYVIPKSIITYSIVGNIQMLKDYGLIQEVVFKQKELCSQKFSKFYRLIKSFKKQIKRGREEERNLREFITKQIRENFTALDKDGEKIELVELAKVAHLCGRELEKDELVFLSRECCKDGRTVHVDDFLRAVEILTDDVKLDPYITTLEVFSTIIKADFITLNQLRNFLLMNNILEKEDADFIENEVQFLANERREISIDSLACLIRDNIEGYAR